MPVLKIGDITFSTPLFKIFSCYLNYVSQRSYNYLPYFKMHFSSDLTKTIYNVGNNILQDCLIQVKIYSAP